MSDRGDPSAGVASEPERPLGSDGEGAGTEASSPNGQPTTAPATDSDAPPQSSSTELFFGISHERLRRRCRWGSVVLALSFLIPYELVDGQPQFIWQVVSELPPAAALAAFAPSLAGLAILLGTWRTRRAGSLAVVVLGALMMAGIVIELGADAAAWDVLPLPESFTDRPLLALLCFAFAGAGTNLVFRRETRRAGQALLGAAALSAAVFYLWPARGEAPIVTVFRIVLLLPLLPGVRFLLGYGIVLLVAALPGLVAAGGATVALVPPAREPRLLSRVFTFALPALLGFFVFRSLLLTFGDSSLPGTVGSMAALAAFLAMVSAATEVLGELLAARGREPVEQPGWSLQRVASVAAVAVVLGAVAQWVLALPPAKGIDWKLGKPTEQGDKLFGELLPAYDRQRVYWRTRVREQSSAEAMVELLAAEREMLQAARGVDAGVAKRLKALTLGSRDLDLAGRAWFRLVADVNEASRAASLPYYLDPTAYMLQTPDGLRRRFRADGYRIEAVRGVTVGSQRFATLHVRSLGKERHGHQRLGFSRDLQPFALVALDEIEPAEIELVELSTEQPPRCGQSALPRFQRSLDACGGLLQRLRASSKDDFYPYLVALTERHELQHQIDGPHLVTSPAVLKAMGGFAESAQDHVNRELSAYVAELTAKEGSPKLGLVGLLRFALARRGSTFHFVAWLAFEALSEQDLDGGFGGADLVAVAAAYDELSTLDDAALRERAARGWADLYGDDLPEVRPDAL